MFGLVVGSIFYFPPALVAAQLGEPVSETVDELNLGGEWKFLRPDCPPFLGGD